jgi:hypothetical protein
MITRTTGRVSSVAAAMIAAAVLVAGATAPAYAAVDPTTDAAKPTAAKVEKVARYCFVETSTGSHLRKKVCRTRAEWIARSGVDPANEVRK